MTLKENLAQSATLFGAILSAFVIGFGGVWLGMQSIANDIRQEIRIEFSQVRAEFSQVRGELSQVRNEISQVRTEIFGMRTDISNLAQRVARIEGHLGLPAPSATSDRAATDPDTGQPASDPARPRDSTVDG